MDHICSPSRQPMAQCLSQTVTRGLNPSVVCELPPLANTSTPVLHLCLSGILRWLRLVSSICLEAACSFCVLRAYRGIRVEGLKKMPNLNAKPLLGVEEGIYASFRPALQAQGRKSKEREREKDLSSRLVQPIDAPVLSLMLPRCSFLFPQP
jgi:hypothetical protein